ncbi:MAG: putative quinol monooxygenase [Nocardioidaceae bacterium]
MKGCRPGSTSCQTKERLHGHRRRTRHRRVSAARGLPRELRQRRLTGTRGSRLPRFHHHRRPDRPGRVNIFERWESQAAVEAFRGSGPSDEQGAAILSGSVAEYDVAEGRPLFGDETARSG